MDLEPHLRGTLLGTALGDALGLPMERLPAAAIARRFPRVGERFYLLGQTGFVSDDTEQAALVAESLARHPADAAACAGAFRRALLAWFGRLPWGIGLGTLRACLRIAAGRARSGVPSAGNGAGMRAAVIGVFFHDQPAARREFGRRLAEVTHVDPRAVEGALYVAEVAAAAVSPAPPRACWEAARAVLTAPELLAAVDRAAVLAGGEATPAEAAASLKTTGYVVHTLGFATFCFLRAGDDPLAAITLAIRAGGDTDSIAAIVGAWGGALGGEAALPADLLGRIHDGAFGPTHLRALAHALAQRRAGRPAEIPRYPAAGAMARNLALYPVILAHAFRRLLP
jgi:ADP-ribosylglycohydrolase